MNHLVVLLLVVGANSMLLTLESAIAHRDAESAGSSTSRTIKTLASSENTLKRSKRSGYGIPTDPHPGVRTIFRPPHEERDSFKSGGVYQHTIKHSEPHPKNHFFMGQAVFVDNSHVLMDHKTWSDIGHYSNPDFSAVNIGSPPKEIDVANPPQSHYPWHRYWLHPEGYALNQTTLRIYQLRVDTEHMNGTDTPVKLETNPNEFGKDCYVHGYGQVHPDYAPGTKGSQEKHGAEGTKDFYASTKRHYVKMPLEPTQARGCKSTNTCSLSTTGRFSFCPSSGSGSPVYCGQDQKLTYMAKHSDTAGCSSQFDAYHIPRLIDDMGLPGLKSGK